MKKLCLKCGEPFNSKGKYNRLCSNCKKFIREYGFYCKSTKVYLDLNAIIKYSENDIMELIYGSIKKQIGNLNEEELKTAQGEK